MSDTPQTPVANSDAPPHRPTPWPLIALAWLFVAIPGGWGVAQTVMKSMALFQPTTPAAAAATRPAASQPPPPSTTPAP